MKLGVMDKVFFHENLLTFSSHELSEGIKVNLANKKDLRDFVFRWLQDEKRKDVLLYGYDVKQMEKDFKKIFVYVVAAGGVVRNQHNQVLFIKRWARWDLPKGKKEKKETIEDCAVREVEEETGVHDLTVVRELSSSFHLYETADQWYLKKTYWFLMQTSFDGHPTPQKEEDISAVQWMKKEECTDALISTYRSLREALKVEICTLFN